MPKKTTAKAKKPQLKMKDLKPTKDPKGSLTSRKAGKGQIEP